MGYPTFEEITAVRRRARRRATIAALRRAEARARAAGGRLIVFGSVVEGDPHPHSDIDVALMGLAPGEDIDVATEIDTLLTLAGFAADVIPERFLSPSLRQRIERHGREPGALG